VTCVAYADNSSFCEVTCVGYAGELYILGSEDARKNEGFWNSGLKKRKDSGMFAK